MLLYKFLKVNYFTRENPKKSVVIPNLILKKYLHFFSFYILSKLKNYYYFCLLEIAFTIPLFSKNIATSFFPE